MERLEQTDGQLRFQVAHLLPGIQTAMDILIILILIQTVTASRIILRAKRRVVILLQRQQIQMAMGWQMCMII